MSMAPAINTAKITKTARSGLISVGEKLGTAQGAPGSPPSHCSHFLTNKNQSRSSRFVYFGRAGRRHHAHEQIHRVGDALRDESVHEHGAGDQNGQNNQNG